jgi:nitric oxide reductase NorQ protein
MKTKVLKPEEHYINDEPYYQPIGEEIRVFDAAYKQPLPVLLKGPNGCDKTRFTAHKAWRLKRPHITVSYHDDHTASDLVGRFLITSGETIWVDGPLASAVRHGAICYLDEITEARREGIYSFCIAVDEEARDYLPHMYGAARHTVIDNVASLPIKVSDIYRRLTS